VGKLNIKGIAVNSVHLAIIAKQFSFEVRRLVYHVDLLQAESFTEY